MASEIVLITGGGRGIGAATARLAARRGYAVAINYKSNAEAAAKVVNEIEAGGGRATSIPGDMALEGDGGHPGVSSRVQCVINLYGPCDLTTDFVRKNEFANRVTHEFLGKKIDDDLPLYQQASPITHLDAQDPPTLILHGTIDDVVPIEQGDELAAKLKELGIPYLYDRLPGWPHAMDLAKPVNDRCVWLMDRFFAAYLKPAQ